MKNHRINYFKKLVLFCICIGIVPVIILGYFSYAKSSALLLEKANRSNAEMVEQARLRFEQKLKMVDNTQTQFISSSSVNLAMDKRLDSDNYLLYEELIQSIYRLQTYEFGLSEVYLANLNQDWILDSAGRRTFAQHSLSSSFMEYAAVRKASFWTALKSPFFEEGNALKWNMVLVKKIPINSIQPLGLLVAVLPSVELNKMVPQRSEPGEFYVLDNKQQVIAAGNPEQVGVNLSNDPFSSRIVQDNLEANQFQMDINNEPYSITYRKSNYNDWIYVTKVHIEDITKESRAIGWVTVAICLGLLALILLLSLQGSRKLYLPIRKLYEIVLKSPDMPNLSARSDELYWIERRMKVLLGNEAQMTQQLRDFFVHKLLQGAVSSNEITDRTRSGELDTWRELRVVCLRIDTLGGSKYTELDKDLLLFAINNMAGELVSAQMRLNPVVINEFQVMIIGSNVDYPDESRADIYALARNIQTAVKDFLKLPVSIGISRLFTDCIEAPRAFQEAKEALAYGIRLGDESILFLDDMYDPSIADSMTYPQQIVRELIDQIKLLDEETAYRLLDEFMTVVTARNISHQEFQLYLLRLLIDLLRLYQDLGGNMHDLSPNEKSLVNELFMLKSAKEIVIWFQSSMIKPMILFIEKRRDIQYMKISDMVLDIIHREYGTPLSLEICGTRLNYHPEYVGRVFRKETGFAFGDYISRYRLHIAKQLLVETNMTVTEISEKLMYNKPQNFIRYFRKMEGVTPGQFRESFLAKDKEISS
ncbi:helix-turn-helix domain-containing protein [Paenibacillus radicis (ex Xue et al. 2023)]|uniref:Helix-turn-helix domain-containing protein n=1 Tax=Paenibacillus radicis (ex Xue et al. 2023) TaxID=2972489 RepID=A0ABT1YU57_9BACL|nr:helix-turn-helix domain-containing protein [Paenibacillus radicis (ex Xue et al. 2023)]MCR8636723.1 helix-turn-helix domain-containing protein [Paenibacillus radicis (ex Xue et al. 2023)]